MSALDRLVRTEIRFLGREWQSYRTCGVTGLALAILLTQTLVVRLGLSPWVFAAVSLSSVATFFALVLVTRIVAGADLIINYHHEIAVILTSALLLRLLGRPVLPYLDLNLMGVGLFVACGRIGCFLVGCCHGRAHARGVCYREEHAEAGFPHYLVGVRLIPVQLMESAWVFFIVGVDVALVLGGAPPGAALAWHATAYGIGRFCFELLRGDAGRRYVGGFSEAQWTSLAVLSTVSLLEMAGILPFQAWQPFATLALAGAMIALAATDGPDRRLFHPWHVRQLAEILEAARARCTPEGEIHMGRTSLGVQISSNTVRDGRRDLDVFAFSCRDLALSDPAARRLAWLIRQLRHAGDEAELVKGNNGVYHLILPSQRSAYAL